MESAKVWGPHYWFFLHTLAKTYPEIPSPTVKRKYYDLLHNMSMFIPDPEMSKKWIEYLDLYPVTPYLKTKESLQRWVVFIHNKVNRTLDKEHISFEKAMYLYERCYDTPFIGIHTRSFEKRTLVFLWIVFLLICIFLMST